MAYLNPPNNGNGDSLGWNSFWNTGYDLDALKSDAADLPNPTRGIRVGQAGDVKITTFAGNVLTLKNCQVGEIIPYFVKRLWSTGTTALYLTGGE